MEIKARLENPRAARARAQAIADGAARLIFQHDTFFRCPQGRLKLRDFGDGCGELIHYLREDRPGPSESRYSKVATADPEGLRQLLAAAYGVAGEVVKQRELLLVGRTRIHLDTVVGLGSYLELEVMLDDGESIAHGQRLAEELLTALGVDPGQLEPRAYVDLLP